jgi:alpha-galactosidase
MLFICSSTLAQQQEIALTQLDLKLLHQAWGTPKIDQSVLGNPLSIGGERFERGLGSHAGSRLYVEVMGAKRFVAKVGVDDEAKPNGSVIFRVYGDGKKLFDSGLIKRGDKAKLIDLNLDAIDQLILITNGGPDGLDNDHADWCDAKFFYLAHAPRAKPAPTEKAEILTPKAGPAPKINGAKVFGVRPGSPVLYRVAATGDRPMEFSADGLPDGVTIDATNGQLSGSVSKAGEYRINLVATNARGRAESELRLVAGDKLALTPPMGWNSWNCFAEAVDEAKVKSAAEAMVKTGLINHGWNYINIDDCWAIKPESSDPKIGGPVRHDNGRIRTNQKFPDMKALVDYIHSMGLKAGIYSSPGRLTCAKYEASLDHEVDDANQWAEWGFDYLKYDWCSYGEVHRKRLADGEEKRESFIHPYRIMQKALESQKRDIVYSLCQYGMNNVWEWGAEVNGNCWRTTGDITDTWESVESIGFSQAGHEKFADPGRWNDPDMLVVGKVGWGPRLHPTRLTPNEQYTHISLWCLLASPLLIGCDMSDMDEFTSSLLTNDEVIAINQDPLGTQAVRVWKDEEIEIWSKPLSDGSKAVGIFNRGEIGASVSASWERIGVTGPQLVRDVWRQSDTGKFAEQFQADVPRHGVVLIKLTSAN